MLLRHRPRPRVRSWSNRLQHGLHRQRNRDLRRQQSTERLHLQFAIHRPCCSSYRGCLQVQRLLYRQYRYAWALRLYRHQRNHDQRVMCLNLSVTRIQLCIDRICKPMLLWEHNRHHVCSDGHHGLHGYGLCWQLDRVLWVRK